VVKDVKAGGAAEKAGLKAGDRIIDVGGSEIFSPEQLQAIIGAKEAGKNAVFDVERGADKMKINVANERNGLGFSVYEMVYLPRIAVEEVKKDSPEEKAGIRPGDVFLKINGTSIYFQEDFAAAFSSSRKLNISLMRDFKEQEIALELNRKNLTIITGVLPDTPAEKAGFKSGDTVVGINGMLITSPEELIAYTGQHKTETLLYEVKRGGQSLNLSVKPGSDGLIGVSLSQILSYENSDLSVYAEDVPVSVTNIKGVSYPIWEAPFKALDDSGKLAYLTVGMFGDVIKSIVTKLTVPEGVAGPVGIAVMTHVFVQEGLLSLLRFTALLSLSLAIINIFPLPALDGGRLFFILIEIIVGRRLNPKFEAYINAVGFALLLMLIFYVTYSDIVKIIS
jgi:RIP metalloprotease RseP